jgi:pimeloyl-ACP methyl ester carboxylesterase
VILSRKQPEEGGLTMRGRVGSIEQEYRFDVKATDGVRLAVWSGGEGPALVLVHGSIADHTTFDTFVSELRRNITTYAMDRRGFGASEDGRDYTIQRDFSDVAAVVDAISARTHRPVALWGHSYGANCAMGAAALTDNVSHLILYEPSLGLKYPSGSIEQIEAALARGEPEAAIVAVLVDILELNDGEIDAFRKSPMWPARIAAAPTVPRECHAEEDWIYQPGQFDSITAASMLLSGSQSVPAVVDATHKAAERIPGAQIRVLEGHAHFAHRTDPQMVHAIINDFLAA